MDKGKVIKLAVTGGALVFMVLAEALTKKGMAMEITEKVTADIMKDLAARGIVV